MKMDNRINHEIAHGKKIAQNAEAIWNWDGAAGKVRFKRRVNMLSNNIQKNTKVLEIGCGTGLFTKEISAGIKDYTAIDISPELINKAKAHVDEQAVKFLIENAYAMSFKEASFDYVYGSSVLHHMEIKKCLSEIFRVLRKAGKIAFTEPNMFNPQIALQKNISFIGKRLGDSPDETAFFKWKLKRQFKQAGFIDIKIIPFDFLHPALPTPFIKPINTLGMYLEKLPLIKEIAGSLFISARKE
ncbi:MAG: class I SAM-dependent methyltransferase [Pseudomonadota bacterium]